MLELTAIKLLKENWKAIGMVLFLFAFVTLFLHDRSETRRANENQAGRDAAIQTSKGLSIEVGKYRNKLGDTVTVLKSIMVPKSQVKAILDENDLKWIKRLEGTNKNGSNLQSAETFTVKLEDDKTHTTPVNIPCPKDSFKLKWFHIKDKWNDISVFMADSSRFKTGTKISIAHELARKKNWFIKFQWSKDKKFQPVLEIISENKYFPVDSVVSIVVK